MIITSCALLLELCVITEVLCCALYFFQVVSVVLVLVPRVVFIKFVCESRWELTGSTAICLCSLVFAW